MKYIEQYDEQSGYTFEIPELEAGEYSSLEDFLLGSTPEIYAALLSALYNGINLDCDRVPVFAVAGSDSVVTLGRDEYKDKIRLCTAYFSELEEYEICQTLTDLENKL